MIPCILEVALSPVSTTDPWKSNAFHLLTTYYKSKKFGVQQLQESLPVFEALLPIFDSSVDILDVIIAILTAADGKDDKYYDTFEVKGGLDSIFTMLINATESAVVTTILDALFQLASLGPGNMIENIVEVDRDSPFQHDSFLMPLPSAGNLLYLTGRVSSQEYQGSRYILPVFYWESCG